MIKVGVLFGGRSVENEVSVVTAQQTIEAMDRTKYDITPIYIAKSGKWYSGQALLDVNNYKDLDALFAKCDEVYFRSVFGDYNLYRVRKGVFAKDVVTTLDVILPTLHGTNCEDGTLQGVLDTVGIPYVGCNTLASANGMDKITMKMILSACGIPVVDYVWFCDKDWDENREAKADMVESKLGYPVIVKPANSGSSVGISVVHNREELLGAVDEAFTFTTRVIVEALVRQLKEVNCSVRGDYFHCEPSALEVPVRSGEILSYADKYMSGGGKQSKGMRSTQRELPADLPADVTQRMQQMAVDTFRALSCDGVARIDLMIDGVSGALYVNEINTIPGSLSYYLWEYGGESFRQQIDRLIDLAFARKREQGFKTTEFGGNIFTSLGKGQKFGCKK